MSQWKTDLANIFQNAEKEQKTTEEKQSVTNSEVAEFYSTVVKPAFEELQTELQTHGRQVTVSVSKGHASIVVNHEGDKECDYSIKVRTSPGHAFPYPETRFTDPSDGKSYRSEGHFRSGSQDYTTKDITKEEVIKHFLADYREGVRARARRR